MYDVLISDYTSALCHGCDIQPKCLVEVLSCVSCPLMEDRLILVCIRLWLVTRFTIRVVVMTPSFRSLCHSLIAKTHMHSSELNRLVSCNDILSLFKQMVAHAVMGSYSAEEYIHKYACVYSNTSVHKPPLYVESTVHQPNRSSSPHSNKHSYAYWMIREITYHMRTCTMHMHMHIPFLNSILSLSLVCVFEYDQHKSSAAPH